MNKEEARSVLHRALQEWRIKPYSELCSLLSRQETFELKGDSGMTYQLEIQAVWDDEHKKHLRVMGSIDDGRGLAAFVPLTENFIITPDGSFIGE